MRIAKPTGSYDDDQVPVTVDDFATAPTVVLDGAENEGRLHHDFSLYAGKARAHLALAQSVRWQLKHRTFESERARGLAELAVTGRAAGEQFADMEARRATEAEVLRVLGEPSAPARTALTRAVQHARRVKTWIDSRPHERTAAWGEIFEGKVPKRRRYIAVSGENDLPRRPINVSRTDRDEDDLTVVCATPHARGGRFRTRVRFATSANVTTAQHVILLLHGLGSRLEETDELSRALASHGIGTVALDLPNHGYSERVPFSELSVDFSATGMHSSGPCYALEMLEAFVDAFADSLVRERPELKLRGRMRSVGGGSLGGSLSLRLGVRRPRWLDRVVAWSPGNAWKSFWDDDDLHRLAVNPASPGIQPIERVSGDEHSAARGEYIRATLDALLPTTNKPMWHLWWRDGDYEKARQSLRRGARVLRHEVYDEWHRRWCSALAHEQLASSMRGGRDDGAHGDWPWDRIAVPLLLMAGDKDNFPFANIHDASRSLAERAKRYGKPTGRAMFLANTGHSIHDERPVMLAANIAAFLHEHAQ